LISMMTALVKAFPSPVGLAAWIAVTVPLPLLFAEATHRWEEDQHVSTALGWTVGALPILAGFVAARWTRRRGIPVDLVAALGVAGLVSALFLAANLAFYRWVVPLTGDIGWTGGWRLVLLLVGAGAVGGYLVGRTGWRPSARWARPGLRLGAVIAVAGAILAPVTVRLGAEDSTIAYDDGRYGGVGPMASAPGGPGVLVLPAAGRYAIMAMGEPGSADCRVGAPGDQVTRRAEPVRIPPSDYGGDYAVFSWVASFTVSAPGPYTLDCGTDDANYTVGEVPDIRGAVGSLIHWPPPLIWLIGAIPGLWILAHAGRLRRSREPAA
jgi:hypothetical protein